MDSRYNVYFNGQVLDGQGLSDVRMRMAKLFNADQATLDKLFSGKNQLIKRECDKATALKFKQAIAGAGGVAIITQATDKPGQPQAAKPEPAAPVETVAEASTETPAKKMTAAERIAMLAGAPDLGSYAPPPAPTATPSAPSDDNNDSGAFQVEPAGADVLRAEERSQPVVAQIDTSSLSFDEHAERLSPASGAAPSAPDTSHLSMGNAGETIPTLPSTAVPVNPNTDGLDLAPSDSDLSDCAPPPAEPLALDLSAIEVAAPGADVLEDQFKRKYDTPAPTTNHLSLED